MMNSDNNFDYNEINRDKKDDIIDVQLIRESGDIEKTQKSSNGKSLPDYLALIKWIEANPKYAHLSYIVDEKNATTKISNQEKITTAIKNTLLSNPTEYYGRAYVTDTMKNDAVVVSRLVNASNLLDFVGNSPLWFFAFKSMGSIPAFLISLIMSVIVLKFSNDLSTNINRSNEKCRKLSKLGLFSGLIVVNIVQSLASGIGVELFNNQGKLNQLKATEIIEQQIIIKKENIEAIKNSDSPQYLAVKQQCENGEKELNQLSRNNSRWDSLFVNLYGTWQQQDQDWNKISMEKLPICRQLTRLQNQIFVDYKNAKKDFNNLLLARGEVNNDLFFLEQKLPTVYEFNFNEKGEMKSGIELVTFASNNFFNTLFNGNMGNIILPLFILSFSAVTSFVSCVITWNYSEDEDVKLSWDENLRQKRDLWLEKQWRDFISAH